MNYSAKQIFKLSFILLILINFSLVSAYIDKDNYFSINSSYIVNTAPSGAILYDSKKNNKMYPELGFTFNRSLLSNEEINILFKSDFFYRGYITDLSDDNDDSDSSYDFDFNRDIAIENFFFEFSKFDKDSIFSFDIGRKDIEPFSPLYRNDGIFFELNSYESGMKFNFIFGKNQNYENSFNKLTFDSLNLLVGFSNIQERFIDTTNPKTFFLDYEINYTKTKIQDFPKNYISSTVSAYNFNYYQARTSFEYNIPSYSTGNDTISSDYEGLTFFNFGISALAKEFPLVSANYSYINYLTDDYGDTTYISDNNFHNLRFGYKKIFTGKSRLSTRFFIDLQTGDYESRAITAIIKKDNFLFGNDYSLKAKFGSSENYNLINIGVKTEQILSNYSNVLLSYGIDIYAYITEIGDNVSFAPNLFVYGKNLFQVESLSYKFYLRETVYPKSFFRKTLFKFELNYEVQ